MLVLGSKYPVATLVSYKFIQQLYMVLSDLVLIRV